MLRNWTVRSRYYPRVEPGHSSECYQVYRERMIRHWSTFVSRSELEELVMAGVSHVRIPVGKVSQSHSPVQ